MIERNGGRIGTRNQTDKITASGIWTPNQQNILTRRNRWPIANVPAIGDFHQFAAGFSLRQLRTAFTGAVVLVRRSSDDAELGFTSNQILDGTLVSWVGAGNNGFVKTWYDQSGNNRHATQATAAQQPQIVKSGALILNKGRPVVELVDRVGLATTFTIGTTWSIFLAGRNTKTGFTRMLNDSSNTGLMTFNRNSNSFYHGAATISNTTVTPGTATALGTYIKIETASAAGYINGVDRTVYPGGSNSAWPDFAIGSSGSFSGETPAAQYYEVLVYAENKTSSRLDIEANINDFYAIY